MPSPFPLAASSSNPYQKSPKPTHVKLLRFGEAKPAGLSLYANALEGVNDFVKYGSPDPAQTFDQLPQAGQDLYANLIKTSHLTPDDVRSIKRHFGILEESSDTMLEIMAIKAIREKAITPQLLNQFKNRLPSNRGLSEAERIHDITTMLDEMWRAIPKKKRDSLIKSVPVEPQYTKKLLQMLLLKYTGLNSREKNFDLWKHTKKLAIGEAKEFDEVLPRWSPYRLLVVPMAYVYTYTANVPILRNLPIAPYFKLLTHIDNKLLNINIKTDHLFGLVTAKQALRQVFEWFNQAKYKNNHERKAVWKVWEMLYEAICIKDARIWKDMKTPTVFDNPFNKTQ